PFLPLHRLRQSAEGSSRLSDADAPAHPAAALAAFHLRLPPGERGARSLLVASAGFGRSGNRAHGRDFRARPGDQRGGGWIARTPYRGLDQLTCSRKDGAATIG